MAKEKGGSLTSLGGSPENSSYKGYGLAVMVNILASCLSGATLITDPLHTQKPVGMDIGHFFLAIDPNIFRESDDFQADGGVIRAHDSFEYGQDCINDADEPNCGGNSHTDRHHLLDGNGHLHPGRHG